MVTSSNTQPKLIICKVNSFRLEVQYRKTIPSQPAPVAEILQISSFNKELVQVVYIVKILYTLQMIYDKHIQLLLEGGQLKSIRPY